jgi:hypothetical protein
LATVGAQHGNKWCDAGAGRDHDQVLAVGHGIQSELALGDVLQKNAIGEVAPPKQRRELAGFNQHDEQLQRIGLPRRGGH